MCRLFTVKSADTTPSISLCESVICCQIDGYDPLPPYVSVSYLLSDRRTRPPPSLCVSRLFAVRSTDTTPSLCESRLFAVGYSGGDSFGLPQSLSSAPFFHSDCCGGYWSITNLLILVGSRDLLDYIYHQVSIVQMSFVLLGFGHFEIATVQAVRDPFCADCADILRSLLSRQCAIRSVLIVQTFWDRYCPDSARSVLCWLCRHFEIATVQAVRDPFCADCADICSADKESRWLIIILGRKLGIRVFVISFLSTGFWYWWGDWSRWGWVGWRESGRRRGLGGGWRGNVSITSYYCFGTSVYVSRHRAITSLCIVW